MKNFLKSLKLNEGALSSVLGVLIVAGSVVLLVNYFRMVNKTPTDNQTLSAATEEAEPDKEISQSTGGSTGEYTISQGDSLWKIAEKTYGSGYEWTKIYEANKASIGSNPSQLAAGTKLSLPSSEAKQPVKYTVKSGDSLWKIADSVCGSGYQWTRVAQDNGLTNPGLIYPDQELNIVCGPSPTAQLSLRE